MLIDLRTYRVKPFTLHKQLALFKEHGLPILRKYVGDPLGFFLPLDGDPNSYVHIWVYRDFADRQRRRRLMDQDPAWHAFLERAANAGYLLQQESRLMTASDMVQVPMPRTAELDE
jgi:hypothetical protein